MPFVGPSSLNLTIASLATLDPCLWFLGTLAAILKLGFASWEIGEKLAPHRSIIANERDMVRRLHVPFIEFDSRAVGMSEKPNDSWDAYRKSDYVRKSEKLKNEIAFEHGSLNVDAKLENMIDIGTIPLSISSHHNEFMIEARNSFICGFFYASLTASCSLGERMLNHMILDLKDHYDPIRLNPELSRGRPSSNWKTMLSQLISWGCIDMQTYELFLLLKKLRDKSVHFNLKTYESVRSDAIKAYSLIRRIVDRQFSCFGGNCKWIIFDGFRFMVKGEYTKHPFVMAYYLKVCPKLSPHYSYSVYGGGLWLVHDGYMPDDEDASDDDFIRIRNESRKNKTLIKSEICDEVNTLTWAMGKYWLVHESKMIDGIEHLVLYDPYFDHPKFKGKGPVCYYAKNSPLDLSRAGVIEGRLAR